MPFVRGGRAAEGVVPSGKMVLAWHTNIASLWLDPQQHDGTASPHNLIMALHGALIKNFREVRYDHPALAEGYDFAEDEHVLPVRRLDPRPDPGDKTWDKTPPVPSPNMAYFLVFFDASREPKDWIRTPGPSSAIASISSAFVAA